MGTPCMARWISLSILSCALLAGCGWHLRSRRSPPATGQAAASSSAVAPKPGRVTAMDLSTFVTMREQGRLLVYDVRPSWYYALGHIPGAESFPGRSFEEAFPIKEPAMKAALACNRVIVVYCTDEKCPDGGMVAGWLSKRGIPVSVLSGGWETWKAACTE